MKRLQTQVPRIADYPETAAAADAYEAAFPDMLAGADIPLSARMLAIVAVYEALRSRRPHRPPLSHSRAVKMLSECAGEFDPVLLEAFVNSAARFDQIHLGQ